VIIKELGGLLDPDVWWQDVEINLRGTFHTCRMAAPVMLDRDKGRIVNLVGGGTGNSFPNGSGYASSKAAIMRSTECSNDRLVTLLVDAEAEKRLESVLLTKKPNWRACQKAVGRPRVYQGVKISTRNETWP
jgi:hypothetical protein